MRANHDNYESGDDVSPPIDELLLQRYLDGELRPHERRELEIRLADDRALAASLERLRDTCEVLATGQPEPVSLTTGFADRLWSRMRREGWPEPAGQATRAEPWSEAGALLLLKRWSLAAAAAVLLLTGFLVLWRPAEPRALQADPEVHELLRDLDRKAQQVDWTEAEKVRRRDQKPGVAGDNR